MSASYDLAAANATLKELYDDQVVQSMVYKNNPFLALVKKKTDFGGKYKPIPIITTPSMGRSATFSDAQSNQQALEAESFLLKRQKDYSIATIDNETMLASRTDKMAFIEGSKAVIDNAIRVIRLSMASAVYRRGTGSLSQAGSLPGAGVIPLINPNDAVLFERNMVLQASSADGSGLRTNVGYVIAVDRTVGTITVSASGFGGSPSYPAAGSSAWAANDYLLVQGDQNLKMNGLLGWLPPTSPTTGDNWFGVDRSVEPTRLAGVRYNGQSQSIEEALIDATTLVEREDGQSDYCFVNHSSWSALQKALLTRCIYEDVDGPIGLKFKAIVINGASGPVKVIADRNCPGGYGFLLQMDSWSLESLGEAPMILKYGDGMEMLRVANQDAAELRIAMYGNLCTNAPGWNGIVQLGA